VLRERLELVPLSSAFADRYAGLREQLDGDLVITSRSGDGSRWLVQAVHDVRSTEYYLWEPGDSALTHLFDAHPELNTYDLAAHEPFDFAARDGRQVSGYLLFPPGVAREDLPAVLLVHGGPASRHEWGWYDLYMPMAQWLASLGYLVVEVNYRGSSGYGMDHLTSGWRQWGARMQDDLHDAAAWAAERGYADPARVAIIGASYGGYAALVGASFTPEAFRCAVSINGPSNLITLMNSIPAYWATERARLVREIGDPECDGDLMWSRSPLSRVDDVSRPVLLTHGARDARVKQVESDQFAEALRKRGVPCTYLVFPDEGHVFMKPATWATLLPAIGEFLAEHHPSGRHET
jgi:dipeptidyl aminopeptidase/acylaminoacyl peptidase